MTGPCIQDLRSMLFGARRAIPARDIGAAFHPDTHQRRTI